MNKFIKIIIFLIGIFSLLFLNLVKAEEKIKIGLLMPITVPNKNLGQSIVKAVKLALKDIDSDQSNIENLLKNSEIEEEASSSEQSTSIESSILKKIK